MKMNQLTGFIVDTVGDYADEIKLNEDLNRFRSAIHAETILFPKVFLWEHPFRLVCDRSMMGVPSNKVSSKTPDGRTFTKGSILLFGYREDGKLRSLDPYELRGILNNTQITLVSDGPNVYNAYVIQGLDSKINIRCE